MTPTLADTATTIQSILQGWLNSESLAMFLAAVIHVALVAGFFGLPAGIFIWAERKISGRIQDRLGPTRVGGKFGWLQAIADGGKLIQKEDLVPEAADGPLFRVAPYVVVVSSLAAFMFLPFSDGWIAISLDIGLYLMLAVMSLEVIGVILAGYASGSKWALFGGMREAAQMVSYEIPMSICVVIPIITAGSLNLNEIGGLQSGHLGNWIIFHDPFSFLAFFVYFVCATASCKRAPFDLAEAESELVAGFLTEYSGFRWSFFFLAEYASMFAVCGIAVLLFLGGWHTGIPGLDGILDGPRYGSDAYVWTWLANALGFGVFFGKASLLVCVQIWVRWTLPRLRIDQVMMTCLKYLVPISCVLFLGAVIWPLALSFSGKTTIWGTPTGERAAPTMRLESISNPADQSPTASTSNGETGP
ncbi:MAG: NADH-quinone oxidoreductase subunit NuoH [Planctomycetales bacterium]|nr:NADH-quinone oxidoreductase subunit NuoH [Planctomycetales bacterium]